VELDGDGLVFSALKPSAEGPGLVLRCYNAGERASAGTWRIRGPVSAATQVRLDEGEPRPLSVRRSRGLALVPVRAGPGEIVTIVVT
jgi:alpha-mannosidase